MRLAAVAAALSAQASARAATPVLRTLPSGWRNSVMPPERAGYARGADVIKVSYRRQRDGRFAVDVTAPGPAGAAPEGTEPGGAAARLTVTVYQVAGGWIDLAADGRRHRRHVFRRGDRVWVQGPDGDIALTAVPRFPAAEPEPVAGGLVAPMPGTVLAVHAQPGDTVGAGQLLMIVEAMKMEHRITAPQAGILAEIRARPGDQVSGGDLLAVITAAR